MYINVFTKKKKLVDSPKVKIQFPILIKFYNFNRNL